jgi:predicted transcriptional regulator
MVDLFTVENKIRIKELKPDDVIRRTDDLTAAFELMRKHQQNYPNIEKWFKAKVLPGIKTGERGVYLGFNNDKPIASAIVKKGEHAKFCHLHIEEELQNQNLGNVFFMLMSLHVKRFEKILDVHFSLPESLWETKQEFFKSFGFENAEKYHTQYRTFEEELISFTSIDTLWSKILDKLPTLTEQFAKHPDSPLNGIVMSVHPRFSDKIMEGEKVVEIRRKFNPKWKNHKVTIYSSSPVKGIVGHATIQDIVEDEPETVWYKYSERIGCSKLEYDKYTKGLNKVYAICLSRVSKYHSPLSLSYMSHFFDGKITPPQSYSTIHDDPKWKTVISMAEIIHGRLNVFDKIF